MVHIEPPRTAIAADRTRATGAAKLTEPATSFALWPTFMRRTLEERQVHPAALQDSSVPRQLA